MKGLAIGLIVIGIAALAWGGISWTQSEKVVDLGPLEVRRDKEKTIPLPPVLGAVALLAGGLLLVRR